LPPGKAASASCNCSERNTPRSIKYSPKRGTKTSGAIGALLSAESKSGNLRSAKAAAMAKFAPQFSQ
jgi:hypothetical protein